VLRMGSMTPPQAAEKPGPHPLLAALDRAPIGEPFTAEQQAELAQAMNDIAAGRVQLVRHEDVPAWLEAHAREVGDRRE